MDYECTQKTRRSHQERNGSKALTLFLIFLCLFFCVGSHATTKKQESSLSLQDAIHLSLRENPNVKNVKLAETLQRFNVETEEWRFRPHFSLSANASSDRIAAAPEVSYLSPIGTNIKITPNSVNSQHADSHVTFKVSQPLLRGFGRAIVEAALYDARDSEKMAQLNIEGSIRATVTNVINAYLDVVASEKNIEIDEAALERAVQSVKQTDIFIKSGRKAGNELITVKANVANARASLENSKNALSQTRYAMLNAIGLDPNKEFHFSELNIHSLIKKYEVLSVEQVKKLAVENDIQYQTDVITLHGVTTRALMLAEDRTRSSLSLDLEHQQYDSASLSLTVPIDDQAAKQSVLAAKIALQQAQINLKAARWDKEVNAINNWKTVAASKRSLLFAEDAAHLQEKTYQMSYQKYLHGLIDSLELQTAQFQLIQAQHALLTAQISYLKSLVNLDLLVGHTLKTWNIDARLG